MHPITDPKTTDRSFTLPPLGDNPSTQNQGTTPGSFALAPDLGGPLMFPSPDTPGMPPPSSKTAWDFLPDGWSLESLDASMPPASMPFPSTSSPSHPRTVSSHLPGAGRGPGPGPARTGHDATRPWRAPDG